MKSDSRHSAPLLWVPLLLVVLALGLRWMKAEWPSALPNFSPAMALAFTGTLLMPRKAGMWWLLPLLLMAVDCLAMGSQFFTMGASYPEVYAAYVLFGVAGLAAGQFRGRLGTAGTLVGVSVCSVVFYVVTNTLSWWTMPEYAKSLEGLVQALTTGLPGLAPTWTFFRNSLLSDLGFSVLMLAAYHAESRIRSLPSLRTETAAA